MADESIVTFCIPVLPKARAKDWDRVCLLFRQSLDSLERQTNPNLRVLVASHEPDELPRNDNLDMRFLEATWEVDDSTGQKLRDKRRKKALLYRELRGLGGGFAMQLDADDLVSRRLVEYVLDTDDPNGYVIKSGYAFDWTARRLAPIPGVFSRSFDSVCGSCLMVRWRPEDLPVKGDKEERLFDRLKQHAQYQTVMEEAGRPLHEIPFPAAVYVMNHDNNLHFTIATDRVTRIPRQVKKNEIALTPELEEEFTLPAPSGA